MKTKNSQSYSSDLFGLILFNKPITFLPILVAIIVFGVISVFFNYPGIVVVGLMLLISFVVIYKDYLIYYFLLKRNERLVLRGVDLTLFKKPLHSFFIGYGLLLFPVALLGYFLKSVDPFLRGIAVGGLVMAFSVCFDAWISFYVKNKFVTELIKSNSDLKDISSVYGEIRELLLKTIR